MQESFTYFKIFKPISWGKRPAERRSRLIQRFPNLFLEKPGAEGVRRKRREPPLTVYLLRFPRRRAFTGIDNGTNYTRYDKDHKEKHQRKNSNRSCKLLLATVI